MEENGQVSFINPANYEAQKTKKFRQKIGRIENMAYNAEEDYFTCAEGRKLSLRRETSELMNGHFVTTAHYRCESCKDCPRRSACCQAKDVEKPKEVTLKKIFWEKRAQSQGNITTLKNDFGFRRFLTRGKQNVRTEPFFPAMAVT